MVLSRSSASLVSRRVCRADRIEAIVLRRAAKRRLESHRERVADGKTVPNATCESWSSVGRSEPGIRRRLVLRCRPKVIQAEIEGWRSASEDGTTPGGRMSVSLCESCSFAREIVSGKGSRFLLCEKSRTDERFPKYPRQPVVRCHGFVEATGGNETERSNQKTRPTDRKKQSPGPD